jgi:hypothetical protein
MGRTKVKVISVDIGNFDVDSFTVVLDGIITHICFDKKSNINQYLGKEIYLVNTN